ncbi:hypothetical protein BIZ78_gp035 [Erwinia phage vB_EamM_Caitlin]|uniref:hypothetical protein n=1 Tax=Erwinia phage vB_EamM_Caitlin TaxID=1883379 RepID=UPI00081CF664|nr:hypothetical protein BIZ78_gp035 [Erwinia phage vB_EamM_Caitlin]ANZ48540.1 hypothetical protein CAITLIN_245 [Erwinia phage vB_EamM_Caitlin]
MSKTQINYDLVVKELSKGLIALDSDVAKQCNMLPHIALSEFRTIRYGAGRQKGVTEFVTKLAGEHQGPVLVLTHATPLRDEFIFRVEGNYPGKNNITSLSGYFPENWRAEKFSLVVIDEAGFFFKKFGYDKMYRSLATQTTDDVVIHLIN